MTPIQQMLLGVPSGDQVYIDNIFKAHCYIGDGVSSPTAINTGINVSENGGFVWIKSRSDNSDRHHCVFNTLRGTAKFLRTSESAGEQTSNSTLDSYNTNGFSIRNDSKVGANNKEYVAWTFVKQEKFMDTFEYTGNGTAGHQIAHNLGCTPGMIWIKKRDGNASWFVWHQNLSNTTSKYLVLDGSAEEAQNENPSDTPVTTVWNNTAPTSTHFTVGTNPSVNTNGSTYIVYLFAHDQQVFGESGDQSVMKMGTYTGNGSSSSGPTVNLGWEPQLLMIKNRSDSGDWVILDTKRRFTPEGDVFRLKVNNDTEEDNDGIRIRLEPDGFKVRTTDAIYNSNGDTFVYWAIRRPDGYVGKPPEAGTDCFSMDTGNSSAYPPAFDSAWDVDIAFQKPYEGYESFRTTARHYPRKRWEVGGEYQTDQDYQFDISRGWGIDFTSSNFAWMFKRGSTMDITHYYADGANSRAIKHGLGGTPEMAWLKGNPSGSGPGQYNVWHKDIGFSKSIEMGSSSQGTASNVSGYWSAADSTSFTIGSNNQVNHVTDTTKNYHILFFRSLAGISKVGSFTGDGNTNRTINCGFSPRFLWFKIYEGANGEFWLFDTERGWTTGTDGQEVIHFGNPYFQQGRTDWIVPVSTGFKIVSVQPNSKHLNTDGYKFVYWAHA